MIELTVGGVVIAVVNAIRKAWKAKDYEPLLWVVASGIVGGLAARYGLADFTDISTLTGVFMGIAASGGYALSTIVAERFSGKDA